MTRTSTPTKKGTRGKIKQGDKIKTGTTGHKPEVGEVIWTGTAEVIAYDQHRLPVALVSTNKGEMAVIQFAGCWFEQWQWWDSRLFSSREWECGDGELVGETHPEIAARIDRFLATANMQHEYRGKQLIYRISKQMYGAAGPTK